MHDMLKHTTGLPEIRLAAGHTLVREGDIGAGLWILVSGALQITKGGVSVNVVNRPGAVIGEISLLLNAPYSATVVASEPSVVRHAANGSALLSNPAVTHLVAVGLAERLTLVTTYLADLKHQYGDAPGLSMVTDVLNQLAQHQAAPARPGSARDPNPEY
jgi:CRP-like cAMP-binding protein